MVELAFLFNKGKTFRGINFCPHCKQSLKALSSEEPYFSHRTPSAAIASLDCCFSLSRCSCKAISCSFLFRSFSLYFARGPHQIISFPSCMLLLICLLLQCTEAFPYPIIFPIYRTRYVFISLNPIVLFSAFSISRCSFTKRK